jgi:hypothetical protein
MYIPVTYPIITNPLVPYPEWEPPNEHKVQADENDDINKP